MVNILKGSKKRLWARVIAITVSCTCIFPSLHVLAAPKTMAHIKTGSGNDSGRFGSASPKLFVLSDKKNIRDESVSFQMRVGSEKSDTRFRFVAKYVDDNHRGYVAYDEAAGWLIEYRNDNKEGYPGVTGLPGLNQNDTTNISTIYVESGLKLEIENETNGENGEIIVNTTGFISLRDEAGKIGFDAAAYGTAYTDIYFSDVAVGSDKYTNYNAWTSYEDNLTGQVWEPLVVATDKEDPGEPSE